MSSAYFVTRRKTFLRPHATPRQNVLQRNDALQLMHVGTVRSDIRPPCAYRAAFVCGTPLPRASGKNRLSKIAHCERTHDGHEQSAPCRSGGRVKPGPNRSVARIKATTASPTNAPISNVRTRNTCPSRSVRNAVHCHEEAFRQLLLAVPPASLNRLAALSLTISFRLARNGPPARH
jgi:hypothetical protein